MTAASTLTVRIERDDHSESPRVDRDNLGTLVIWHPRYRLGDAGPHECPENPGDFVAWATRENAVWLPVYLYDHSGLAVSTTPFSCPWDSAQVGFIYATVDHMRATYCVKRVTEARRFDAANDLKAQVEELNQFLTGDIWGYVIEDADGEHVESCWGLYGIDYAKEEAARALRDHLEE